MKNTIESNGGSELNDSRQAIQIVQRGRVRHKQAHVPCEISLTKKKTGMSAQEHEPWTSRSQLEQGQPKHDQETQKEAIKANPPPVSARH